MGALRSAIEDRLARELAARRVVVWYDAAREWETWVDQALARASAGEAAPPVVRIGGQEAHVVPMHGSYYEVVRACEPVAGGVEVAPTLVYVPGEPRLEALTPLRELECLGGRDEPFELELRRLAREVLRGAGQPESRIDELLEREGLDLGYLDSLTEQEGGASPLAPVFGSAREVDVVPTFLADPERRAEAARRGLLAEIAALAERGLGLALRRTEQADEMAAELARALLVAEMRGDLEGPEPVAIAAIPAPGEEAQRALVREVCARLRHDHPGAYEALADEVERALGLAEAGLDAAALGRIDTFRFEERALLEACDGWLADGDTERALETARARSESFWTSIARHPDRHAAWAACRELGELAQAVSRVEEALASPPGTARGWIEAYVAPDGWQAADRLHRRARYQLASLPDRAVLERGAERVLARYEALVDRIATAFTEVLERAGWHVDGLLGQTDVYRRRVAGQGEPVAYVLADAMRYEMGIELGRLLEAIGATEVRVEPAVAVLPTITDLGMAALMPGADESFTMAESPRGGVTGAIKGSALVGSAGRMEHAAAMVPGAAEMALDRLMSMSRSRLERVIGEAPIVIVRSQEIDGAGESLPEGIAQKVMGTVLEDLRGAIQRLAEAGARRFVVTADHGHLFGGAKGEEMKIDPPEAGQAVDLHRRCWVGRGGATPPACVRIGAGELGYEGTDLELVVPRGAGVFRAGGSLAFHHGGASLQELIVPVLSFSLERRRPGRRRPKGPPLKLAGPGEAITNRIFAVQLRPAQLELLEPLRVRVLALSPADQSIAAQAGWAGEGWDPEGRTITLMSGEPVDVRLLLDDDTVTEVVIRVIDVATDRVLHETAPIPVRVIQ